MTTALDREAMRLAYDLVGLLLDGDANQTLVEAILHDLDAELARNVALWSAVIATRCLDAACASSETARIATASMRQLDENAFACVLPATPIAAEEGPTP